MCLADACDNSYSAQLQAVGVPVFESSLRGSYSTACCSIAYFTTLLANEPFVGAASSILLRLGLGRYDAQKEFVEFVTACRKQQKEWTSMKWQNQRLNSKQ